MKRKFLLLFFALLGTLGVVNGQVSYDFRDGSIIEREASEDGTLTLSGTYGHHGAQYGLQLKEGAKISISVDGSCTIQFLASQHSSLNLVGSTSTGDDLGVHYTEFTTDLQETYDFVYEGTATVLEFVATKTESGGSDVYLPLITVVPMQLGIEADSAEKNIIYYYDFCDGSIVPADTQFKGKTDITEGLLSIIVGPSNAYGYNGAQHGSIFKTGNQIVLQVAGNSYIKVGGCQHSNSGTSMTVSSDTGEFLETTLASTTKTCYHQDGATIDFVYVGDAGTVTISFDGSTTYVPNITVVPSPFDIDLVEWVQKSGTVTVNGVDIDIIMGATSADMPVVSVSEGMVISTTADQASIRINLGGKELSDVTITHSETISNVSVSDNTLFITYADGETKPYSYEIRVADNSTEVSAEPGRTYSYDFTDGSVLPQTDYETLRYKIFITEDGILTINSNTDTEAIQFGYHDASHGAVLYSGNSIDMIVAGNAIINFGACQYGSAKDAVFILTDASGANLGSVQAVGEEGVCSVRSFNYTGSAGVITATLLSTNYPTAEIYIHGVTIENAAEIIRSDKTDVWDFGAAQFDEEKYINRLTEEIINDWYPGITPGTEGVALPGGFTAGVLSYVGGSSSDRLRTSNTNLTRYDSSQSPATFEGETFTGSLYVNSTAATNRYIGLTLSADDEVSVYAKSQNGGSKLTFEYMGDDTQTDVVEIGNSICLTKFVAKKTGSYHIYDSADKPFYYRILRKDATYVTLSGAINVEAASGIPQSYNLILTNEAGKEFTKALTSTSTTYSIEVPSGYNYTLSLGGANGYIIANGNTIYLEEDSSRDIVIEKVETKTLSGSISGLSSEQLANIEILFTPENEELIYVPVPVIDAVNMTYTVDVEPNNKYIISAEGINDYYVTNYEINISEDANLNIVFAPKPVYKVNITPTRLDAEHLSKLSISFENLNEPGYVYTFTGLSSISLRDGVYSIAVSGLDEYPLELALTSNLVVSGGDVSKNIDFNIVRKWPFDDAEIDSSEKAAYKGMLLSGRVYNQVNSGHLALAGEDATIKVPINAGEKVIVTYYYSANFSIEGGEAVETSSGSTSIYESVEYIYPGSGAGYVTIANISETTYLTDVTVTEVVEYSPVITVGEDKEYQTINAALAAVRSMSRPNTERVKIMVDPGNYEEMLMIDVDSISIINASANPSIGLLNKGVDIDENAVRITGYYGHGYDYFSMGTDQKWSEEALAVNKENGYTNYSNAGSGSTRGSYWNAVVVVSAEGFEASHIIFENSFNQYISKKESEDIVMEWASGGKGTRPTDYGNTAVQDKSFVERAAAIAYLASGDKSILYNCRVVGRQDSFYGAEGARIVAFKGSLMGGTDYLFGGMTLVAYQSDLAMNTSEASTDVAYITAAQQSSARGYLLYECTVTSAQPGTETASEYLSKPGYFGRPWQPNTGEAVFYNTTVKATNNPSYSGQSMILPDGWNSTLMGESVKSYEYGTIEESGVDNSGSRVSWSTVLSTPTLSDGTAITTYNFTKGNDGWDPLPALIATGIKDVVVGGNNGNELNLVQVGSTLKISDINSITTISVYGINGVLANRFNVSEDSEFTLQQGFWIVRASNAEGQAVLKVLIP